jgi:DNA-directed RNA polymerase specialized sigma24 family protein
VSVLRITSAQLQESAAQRLLVDRCLAGTPAAWDELYAHQHDQLMASIRSFLRPKAEDAHLVEEIAARVWFALVSDGGRLLARFSPERGSLQTYLALLAKSEASNMRKSELSRRRRENEVEHRRMSHLDDSATAAETDIDDFLVTLTPRERQFAATVLLQGASEEPTLSRSNAWKLASRVRKKLLKFFDEDKSPPR